MDTDEDDVLAERARVRHLERHDHAGLELHTGLERFDASAHTVRDRKVTDARARAARGDGAVPTGRGLLASIEVGTGEARFPTVAQRTVAVPARRDCEFTPPCQVADGAASTRLTSVCSSPAVG